MTQSIREKAISEIAREIPQSARLCSSHRMLVLDELTDYEWDWLASAAFDAAIQVLMEPDEAMWWAGDDAGGQAGEWSGDALVHDARKSFPAMLKAASQ